MYDLVEAADCLGDGAESSQPAVLHARRRAEVFPIAAVNFRFNTLPPHSRQTSSPKKTNEPNTKINNRSLNRPNRRKILDCGSPLRLWNADWPSKAAEDCRSPRRWRVTALVAALLTRIAFPSAQAQGTPGDSGPAVLCGKAVATCFGGYIGGGSSGTINPYGFVAGVVDVRNPAANGAVLDQNWSPPMYHGPSSSPWNATNLGQVFGVTLDDATPPN